MTDHLFRFGVLATPTTGSQWRETARRVEQQGFDTLVMPDGLQLLSSLPALTAAASVTTTLRVGSFVLASPLRHPRIAAWDAHSVSVLTDGRLDLGLGTGHPGVVKQATDQLGVTDTSASRRLRLVEETIDHLRELDGDHHTPVMVAAGGPRGLALAAAKADIVTLAAGPLATHEQVAELVATLRAAAGERFADIELATAVQMVGDEIAPGMRQFFGVDAEELVRRDSLIRLPTDPKQMIDELQRRRDTFGFSYVIVNVGVADQVAPAVEALTGR